jgi:prepilin-type N-terminal cleavage/methylation domain-containing protein
MASLKQQSGFTVIELIIVIVVVGILSLLVVTTHGSIEANTRNKTRTQDLKSLQISLEAYFSRNSHYPSLADMNNASWLKKNIPTLNSSWLTDPSNPVHSETLLSKPTAKYYAYDPTQADGVTSCEKDDTTCASYTLTATYEGSVNGSTTLVIPSYNN